MGLELAPAARPLPVARQVPRLAGDQHLLALHGTLVQRGSQRFPDRPLAALAAIVDRGVDDVDPAIERRFDRFPIERVVVRAVLSQIGTDANRREPRSRERAPARPRRVTLEIIVGGFRAGATCDPTLHGILRSRDYTPRMTTPLDKRRCVPCEGGVPKLTPEQMEPLRRMIRGWDLQNDRLRKVYDFRNFVEAMKFVNEVARVAEEEQHHPDFCVHWNRVIVFLWTHAL